jgi:hypothetical protein
MQNRSWLNWRYILLFVLLGPFVGATPMLIVSAQAGVASLATLAPIILGWAYLLGVLPACLTALVTPSDLRLLPKDLQLRLRAQLSLAFFTGLVLCWVLFAAFTPFNALYFAMLGGAAASVCSLVAKWLRVGPNYSFKPSPLRGLA